MNTPVMQVQGLAVRYGTHEVLTNFSLAVAAGESVAIMGPSGSGKSSLLACITGMLRPSAGTVEVAGHAISALGANDQAKIRRQQIGLIFQSPDLLPELSVIENVALLMLLDGLARSQALALAAERLAEVGVSGHQHKRVDQISGGQAQRVAVARALARPQVRLLVADEPTASLDATNAAAITDLILQCAAKTQAGVILATHDRAVAAKCDRTINLALVNA